jgi:hypothetical protein
MLRTLATVLGYVCLASGFLAGVVDGTRSIASAMLEWTSMGNTIIWLSPRTFSLLEEAVPRLVHPLVWSPILTSLLQLPTMVVFLILGPVLLWLGGPKTLSQSDAIGSQA